MVTSPDAAGSLYRAVGMSTRPFQGRGDAHTTKVTSECLHDIARQVREECVWMTIEHLSFLPPMGRWTHASVERCDDGEEELVFLGRDLPVLVGEFDHNQFAAMLEAAPLAGAPSLNPELRYDRRNFENAVAAQIELEADCVAKPCERWSELPPLEYALAIPVVWGATKFAGAFLEELGRAAGKTLSSKIGRWSKKSKAPHRSIVFVLELELGGRSHVRGVVVAPHTRTVEMCQAAIRHIEPLATFAGFQREYELLPNMIDSTFFFDGSTWQLGWWTNGEQVMQTPWFLKNAPDAAAVLGRPILESDDDKP